MKRIPNNYCRVTNCKNKTYGKRCSTHRYRWKIYKSYDLPDYQGKPNILIETKLPTGIVKDCVTHGKLTKDQCYFREWNGKISSYYCKECILSKNIKNKYKGMKSLECYDEILKKQNGVCAICKQENTTTRNGKIKRYVIDHCHKTLNVRGLLCSFCNSLIGYAKDSIETLESAIQYLKKSETTK